MTLKWFEAENKTGPEGNDMPNITTNKDWYGFQIDTDTWAILSDDDLKDEGVDLPELSNEEITAASNGKVDPNRTITGG